MTQAGPGDRSGGRSGGEERPGAAQIARLRGERDSLRAARAGLTRRLRQAEAQGRRDAAALALCSATIDDYFARAFDTRRMRASVRAHSDPGFCGARVTKRYPGRPTPWAGLTAGQSVLLEALCLARLNALGDPRSRQHFPRLIAADTDAPELVMSHVGTSLPELTAPVAVADIAGQCRAITDALRRAGVVHLDNHPGGKNICVSARGTLALIDFDIAVVDAAPFNLTLRDRYTDFVLGGGHAQFGAHLRMAVQDHPMIRAG